MRGELERLLREVDVPNPERAELLWAEYRAGNTGAEKAFNTLLAWYGLTIYRRIWGFIRSDAAEDVFQDVLAKLHRERRKLATFDHALRWLRTVAVRECVGAYRRTTRRKAREARRAVRADADSQPGHQFELQEAIAAGLARLPARQREAVALVFFEDMDRQTAAAAMGVNRDTLAKWLGEALDRLRMLIPAPAMLAIGGVVGLEGVLSAKPRFPGPDRMTELVGLSLARTAATGSSAGKLGVGLVLGLAAVGGLTAAGWGMIRDQKPAFGSALKGPTPVSQVSPIPAESVPDRNLRIFRSEILPDQLAALRGLVIGDGDVVLDHVEAYDIRVRCVFRLRHKATLVDGWQSVIEFEHTTLDLNAGKANTAVHFDMFAKGERKPIDLKRPIVLWRNPITGQEKVMKSPPLEAAVAAFDRLPHDAQSEQEFQTTRARLEAAAALYVGVWYAHGDPDQKCEVRLTPTGWLEFVPETGQTERVWLLGHRTDADGQLLGLTVGQESVTLSADGRRIEIRKFQDWWSRDTADGLSE